MFSLTQILAYKTHAFPTSVPHLRFNSSTLGFSSAEADGGADFDSDKQIGKKDNNAIGNMSLRIF